MILIVTAAWWKQETSAYGSFSGYYFDFIWREIQLTRSRKKIILGIRIAHKTAKSMRKGEGRKRREGDIFILGGEKPDELT